MCEKAVLNYYYYYYDGQDAEYLYRQTLCELYYLNVNLHYILGGQRLTFTHLGNAWVNSPTNCLTAL